MSGRCVPFLPRLAGVWLWQKGGPQRNGLLRTGLLQFELTLKTRQRALCIRGWGSRRVDPAALVPLASGVEVEGRRKQKISSGVDILHTCCHESLAMMKFAATSALEDRIVSQ